MGGVVYLAISKKSGKIVRMSALCALGLMVLTLIICLFILFNSGTSAEKIPTEDELLIPPKTSGGINGFVLVIFLIFILALFITVLVLSLREKKLSHAKNQSKIDDIDW